MTRQTALGLGLAAVAAALATLPSWARADVQPRTVRVEATEYAFALTPKSVRHGTVVFEVVNAGARAHDFRIAGKRTPVLAPGETARLTLTLDHPGVYAYFCTVAGHAVAGMKGSLRVR